MDIQFRVWHTKENKMYYRGYQKITHVLLCREGGKEGEGIPEVRANYDDCEFMQSTGLFDAQNREIFEGDIVRVRLEDREVQGLVENMPDMYKSRKLHPLHSLLIKNNISDDEEGMIFEVLGNRYETPELI